MIRQAISSAAFAAISGLYLVCAANAQTQNMQPGSTVETKETVETKQNETQQKSGNGPGKCEAVRHSSGQQEIVKGGSELNSDPKSAPEINKMIIAEMIEKNSDKSKSGDNKKSEQKSAEQVNKQIVENSKKTESGMVVAETGAAKPTENWFGCPPEEKMVQ